MKLLFLYDATAKHEYNLVQGFSFRVCHEVLFVELSTQLPVDFFSLNDYPVISTIEDGSGDCASRVESVSAIVGNNGSGKTRIATWMGSFFSNNPPYTDWIGVVAINEEISFYGKTKTIDISGVLRILHECGFSTVDRRGDKQSSAPYECIYYTPFCADHKIWRTEPTRHHDLSPAAYFDKKKLEKSQVVLPPPRSVEDQGTPLKKYSRLIQGEIIEFVSDCYANGLDETEHGTFPIPGEAWIGDYRFELVELLSEHKDDMQAEPNSSEGENWQKYAMLLSIVAKELNVQAMACTILKSALLLIDKKIKAQGSNIIMQSKMIVFLRGIALFGQNVRRFSKSDDRVEQLDMIWHRVLGKKERSVCYRSITETLEVLSRDGEACRVVKWDQLFIIWQALVKIDEKYDGDVDDDLMLCSFKDKESYSTFVEMMLAHSRMGLSAPFINVTIANVSSGEMSYLAMFARLHSVMKRLGYSRERHVSAKTPLHVILFMDEAETTMHPEWQRQLVSNIIWYFEGFTSNVRVHVIFASHSPMLLSDVPSKNVIYLDPNNNFETPESFGANIFDLYRSGFFLDKGTVGSFAQKKIDDLVEKVFSLVRSRKSDEAESISDEDRQLVDLIADKDVARYLKEWLKELGCGKDLIR